MKLCLKQTKAYCVKRTISWRVQTNNRGVEVENYAPSRLTAGQHLTGTAEALESIYTYECHYFSGYAASIRTSIQMLICTSGSWMQIWKRRLRRLMGGSAIARENLRTAGRFTTRLAVHISINTHIYIYMDIAYFSMCKLTARWRSVSL